MKISLPEPNNITTPYRPSRIKLTTLSKIRPDPTITWTRTCTPPKNLWTDPSLIPKKSSKNSPLRTLTSKKKREEDNAAFNTKMADADEGIRIMEECLTEVKTLLEGGAVGFAQL